MSVVIDPVIVGLRGLPPGMIQQSKGVMEADDELPPQVKGKQRRSHEEEARLHAHWTEDGKFCAIPWVALYKSICTAAGNFKVPRVKSPPTMVASSIACEMEMISLGTKEYEVYVDWVRIPPKPGGGMVKVGRPRFRKWQVEFEMLVDFDVWGGDCELLRRFIEYAGKKIGIGAWRPSLKGPYGKFEVIKFEIG